MILRFFFICFTITGVERKVCYIEDFVTEVRYIKVLLYQVYKLLTICLPQDELFLHGKQLMSLSLDLLSTVT